MGITENYVSQITHYKSFTPTGHLHLLLLIRNTVQYGEIAAGVLDQSAVVHAPLQYGWEQTPNAIYQLPPCYLSAFQLAIESQRRAKVCWRVLMSGLCILHMSVLNDIYYTSVFMHKQYVYIVATSVQFEWIGNLDYALWVICQMLCRHEHHPHIHPHKQANLKALYISGSQPQLTSKGATEWLKSI